MHHLALSPSADAIWSAVEIVAYVNILVKE